MKEGNEWKIRNAEQSDLSAIIMLLSECELPVDGVAESLPNFLVAEMMAERDNMLVGVAGLELYGDMALLRSVAISRDFRDKGIGADLVMRTLERAKIKGVKMVYLLTETAQEYFLHFGFRKIQRHQVDHRVQQSAEFKYACPKSAVAMKLEL